MLFRSVVKAVGPGSRADDGERRPVDLSEGDKVLFGKFAGTEVTYEGTEYLIMREDDILAII